MERSVSLIEKLGKKLIPRSFEELKETDINRHGKGSNY